jgi:hypothetical protein
VCSSDLLTGGLSVVTNADGSVTLSYDNGTDTLLKGVAAEITLACVGTGPISITISNLNAFNTAGQQFPWTGVVEDTIIIQARPGSVVIRQK